MNPLNHYLDARRTASEHDDEPTTVRGASLVPGPMTTEFPDVLASVLPIDEDEVLGERYCEICTYVFTGSGPLCRACEREQEPPATLRNCEVKP